MTSSREAMGMEEQPPSKKRVALRQISKDDDPDSEEDEGGSGAAEGTFRRAPDQVLAERRIVKVRRTPVASSAPNPFAAIRLVAPTGGPSVAPAPNPSNLNSEQVNLVVDGGSPATGVQGEDSSIVIPEVLQPGDIEQQKSIESVVLEEVANNSVASDVKDGGGVDDLVKITAESGDEEKLPVTPVAVTDDSVANGNDNEKTRGAESVGPSGTSSETFEQLSSAKNAFAGSFGTGFSSSPSVFNSLSTASANASSGFVFGKPFTFASQGFGTSMSSFSFGQSTAPFGSKPSSDGAFSSVSSAFGKANGSSPSPLFGSANPTATIPISAPKSSLVSLQEIQVETGEEKEKAIFTADAALFEFLDGGWKERGKGELKLNVSEEKDKRPRMVMRSKGNYRLLLNANLFPDMKLTKMDNRGISFVCANSAAEGKTGLTTYAVKLKDSFAESEFTTTVQAHKGSTHSEPRTPESSPKATERPSKVVGTSEIEA